MNTTQTKAAQGWWTSQGPLQTGTEALQRALCNLHENVVLLKGDTPTVGTAGTLVFGHEPPAGAQEVAGFATALSPRSLGDPAFLKAHGVDFAYVAGAMANGIASESLVEAMARGGMLAFFGAAGLSPKRVEAAIDRLTGSLGSLPFGFNLIHSPNETNLEDHIVDLYLRRGIKHVEASAYLALTLPLVRYRVHGIHRDAEGNLVVPNKVMAKVSRIEVAAKFFAPPPANMLATLVEQGAITAEQAKLAESIPMCDDLTAEADSGGHTDNRPALCLVPTMLALRDEYQARYKYPTPLRVGAAGGIATPQGVCAAFAMGAAYVVTGTVNQSCHESGTSDLVRQMLCQARQADVAMAPAADMFEMGVNVQVLKWGTMFPVRAKKLYELYRRYDNLETLPPNELQMLERDYLKCSVAQEWENTSAFFRERDPKQLERAARDPKHKMALIFRSYLGRSSIWANSGEVDRKVDFQVWCGPAMGAFNEWAKGTFLEKPENRDVQTVAANLLVGAAVLTRVNALRNQGAQLPPEVSQFRPRPKESLSDLLTR